MAKFEGSGKLTLTGTYGRIYDFWFANTGGVETTGSSARIERCTMQVDVTMTGVHSRFVDNSSSGKATLSGRGSMVAESRVDQLEILEDDCRVTGVEADTSQSGEPALYVEADDCIFVASEFGAGSGYGADVVGNRNQFVGCLFPDQGTSHAGLRFNGNRNRCQGSSFVESGGDYAVEIAGGECNMVVGNDLGDCDDWDIDCLLDNGLNTQLFYPADASFGDNFTDCGSGS